jgi:hypothetical protein
MADEPEMTQTSGVSPQLDELPKVEMAHFNTPSQDSVSLSAALKEGGLGDAEGVLQDAKDRARSLRRAADQYVRENPAKAVFGALGFGFVLGLIFRR